MGIMLPPALGGSGGGIGALCVVLYHICQSDASLGGIIFTHTLAQEMRGTGIQVSCVYPGGIRTNIARSMRFNRALHALTRESVQDIYESKLLKITADHAAKTIISGIKRNRRRIIIGAHAKFMDLAVRCFPVAFVTLSARAGDWVAASYARKQSDKK